MPPTTKARRPKSAEGHVANTRPLRSSPLAGPALNPSLANPLLTVTDDPLLTVPSPPLCHVSNPKSSQNLDSCDSSSSTPTTPRRRGLAPITAGSGRTQSLYISSSASDSGHASKTRSSEWEIDPLQSLSISRTPVRPRPTSGIPSFRLPIPIVEEEPDCQVEEIDATDSSKETSRNSSTSEFQNSRSSSHPQVNSWYTANTYDVTPRFTRLGLSSSTVVMPLSPKQHRRVSRSNTTTLVRSNANSSTTSLPTKRFFIPSLSSKPSSLTRVPLQPPPPPLPSQTTTPNRQPLSRTFSTTSSSESSSIASNSQCETPTPISTSTSSPSLTRSRSSDSISTWYESLPPTTPHQEHMTLPAENDGEAYDRDKRAADGGIGGHYRDGQIHYSDITITIKNASDDDEKRPDQVLMTTELHPSQQQPAPLQPTTTNSLTIPTFPKDVVKKERVSSLRKKLVRIKLQPVHDVGDLEDLSSSFSTLNLKTMATITLTTPIPPTTREMVAVGLPETPATVPAVVVNNSEDTLLSTSSISLPMLSSKKKRSTFKNLFKNFVARW